MELLEYVRLLVLAGIQVRLVILFLSVAACSRWYWKLKEIFWKNAKNTGLGQQLAELSVQSLTQVWTFLIWLNPELNFGPVLNGSGLNFGNTSLLPMISTCSRKRFEIFRRKAGYFPFRASVKTLSGAWVGCGNTNIGDKIIVVSAQCPTCGVLHWILVYNR